MPLITPQQIRGPYDAVIVGSGAAGGQAAYTLAMAGATVLMLEAGRNFDPTTETAMFQTPSQAPLRGTPTPDKQYGFLDSSIDSGWTIPGEPYVNVRAEPSRQFRWWRQRMMGGRTNHWGRIALRNGPYDFKTYSRQGVGFDWPISYEDLAPYYDKVEMLIGVFGSNEGVENAPSSSPGVLLPSPKLRAGELYTRKIAPQLGMRVIPAHRAVLSVRQDAETIPAKLHPNHPKAQRLLADSMRGRAACLWATDCHRGCAVKANYQSGTVHLPPALASGNLDIVPNAMAREVLVGPSGQATGIIFIDKLTGLEHRALGRSVVLGAGSQETVRLLLNSKSSRFPHGLGNSNGKVGRYITDSISSSVRGQVPRFENLPIHNEDGAVGPQAYIPWWLHQEQKQLGFPVGYHVDFGTGRQMPNLNVAANLDWLSGRTGYAYGHQLKAEARRYYGSFVGFTAQGAMVPNEQSFSELDPDLKDRWGIPVLRFHWQWSDFEIRQVLHQQKAMAALLEAIGGRMAQPIPTDPLKLLRPGGEIIHEVGGAIMGADPGTSVTNSFSQLWEAKNVVIADGAVFANTSDKNCTLTIMALAWRAAEHLLEEMSRGHV